MARSTNGTSDLISFGDLSAAIGTGDISAVGWFKYTGATNVYGSLFSSGNGRGGGGSDAFNFEHLNNNTFVVDVGVGLPTVVLSSSPDSNWHHWGMSWASSGTVLTGYFDGANKGTATVARGNPSIATTFGVGHNSTGGLQEYANCSGADLAIWAAVLSAGEFAALASGVRPYLIRPASLILYAPLDGLSSPEPDLSGNAHNGTLTGTSAAAGPPIALFTPRMPAFLAAAAAGFTAVNRRTLGPRVGSRSVY